LPKSDYEINKEDEEKYNNITSALTKEQRMSIPRRAIANIVNKLSKKDKYLVFFGDNYGETIIETNCKNGKTLLVVKDSFANSIVPLLTMHYEKIIMIDQRYYNPKGFSPLISKHQVTDALFLYEITNLSIQTKLATACKN
jgi:hypothetical protein